MVKLAAIAGNDSLSLPELLDMCFYHRTEIAFRAAWILEHVTTHYPERFVPYLADFLSRYPKQQNPSCQRHFTNILIFLTGNRAEKKGIRLTGYDMLPIVETTFNWLIAVDTAIAVKANCMEVLYNLRHTADWITEELHQQLLFLQRDGGPAIQSRSRKIMEKLNG
ncbi:hypothetical protein [Pedobacter sp. BS3]|uniref:hypothetical protein n=1 Tax=Pedobacter sp. BS3 TaxID=2567937 RepID=UPI0011ECDE66|nr:hypothetical protein [Pedobacter sp. BS3]